MIPVQFTTRPDDDDFETATAWAKVQVRDDAIGIRIRVQPDPPPVPAGVAGMPPSDIDMTPMQARTLGRQLIEAAYVCDHRADFSGPRRAYEGDENG